MFKKLIVTGAVAGLLLVSAAGAFAKDNWNDKPQAPTVTLDNFASVHNTVNTSANSGFNAITGGSVSGSYINTGAATAGLSLTNQLNFNQFGCGCSLGNVKVDNDAWLTNSVGTSANTGYNYLTANGYSKVGEDWWKGSSSNGVSGSYITTGAAVGSSVLQNIVNTNVFGTTTPSTP